MVHDFFVFSKSCSILRLTLGKFRNFKKGIISHNSQLQRVIIYKHFTKAWLADPSYLQVYLWCTLSLQDWAYSAWTPMAVGSGAAGAVWAAPLIPQGFDFKTWIIFNRSVTFTHSFSLTGLAEQVWQTRQSPDQSFDWDDVADPSLVGKKHTSPTRILLSLLLWALQPIVTMKKSGAEIKDKMIGWQTTLVVQE